MKTRFHIVRRIVAWTSLLLVFGIMVLLPSAYVWLQSGWGRSWITTKIEDTYASRVASTLSIGSIEGKLPFQMAFNDVGITIGRQNQAKDTVLTLDRLEVSIRFWDLLYGQVHVAGVHVVNPKVYLRRLDDTTFTISEAFRQLKPSGQVSDTFLPESLNLYAPSVKVTNGAIYVEDVPDFLADSPVSIPDVMDSLHANLFIEMNRIHRFVDLASLSVHSNSKQIPNLSLSGQFFSDARFTEIKRLQLKTEKSQVTVDLAMDGLDLNKRGWMSLLDSAGMTFAIRDTRIHPDDVRPWTDRIDGLVGTIELELEGGGTLSTELRAELVEIRHQQTKIRSSLSVVDALNPASRSFLAEVMEFSVDRRDLSSLFGMADTSIYRPLSDFSFMGMIAGTRDSLEVDLAASGASGSLSVKGGLRLRDELVYRATVSANQLNLGVVTPSLLPGTNVTFSALVEGRGIDPSAEVAVSATFQNSRIQGLNIDTLRVIGGYSDSKLQARINLSSAAGHLTANGDASLDRATPEYHVDGSLRRVNLASFSVDSLYPSTDINADFSLDLFGSDMDDLYGRVSIDGGDSKVEGQPFPAISAYADLSQETQDGRTFRLTSTFLDAFVTGKLVPRNIQAQLEYWVYELRRQVEVEILKLEDPLAVRYSRAALEPVSLQYDFTIKQPGALAKMIPALPIFQSSANIEGTVLADNERMLLDIAVLDDSLRVGEVAAEKVDVRLTMALKHGLDLGESGNVQMVSSIGLLNYAGLNLENVQTRASLIDDSIHVAQTIDMIGEAARSSYSLNVDIQDSTISVEFPSFFLGNNQYSWRASGVPKMVVSSGGKISFSDFRFVNEHQSITLDGILSEDPDDRLEVGLVDIDLKRISDLINIRIGFEGVLNGFLLTRSLSSQTSIEGHLDVDTFAINERTIGDLRLDSEFNPVLRRFDTVITVKTDTLKYADYLRINNGVGQDIKLFGYVAPKNLNPDIDHLFDFDIEFGQVDLWVLRLLLMDVFTKVEGRATGSGNLRGDFSNLDYDATFEVENAQVVPVFLNTNYTLNGDITFRTVEGLVFNGVRVSDDKRGTGVLNGTVDMNDFRPEKFLDLRLRMNRLEFLNNTYDPDVPFYGRVSGSGDMRLFGPTTKLFLQTLRPITVTPNSKLYIPLLDVTTINQQTNFIRFVNEFFEGTLPIADRKADGNGQVSPRARSFYDIFQLDLQFNMPQDAAIEFIFDPVTNEYITTRGTGSVRMTLENANLGMFGTFDIDRGEYNFVGGDIFSKKFKIRPGGQVIWDGDAQDPRIEVTAFFTSRPNLAPLGTGRDVRAPIDLILNLNGRIASIENEFYFAYPATNFDQALTASELNILNGEDQKLLQATSLLITGNFLPVSTGEQNDANLQNKMTQAGIGQLLSSQINYVLNSSLSNFDFDLNLTGFDQADLGIGLRLFDDRLELRRDGTIVGDQTNIGDLAATYRINRFFSVEIFHRQDINATRGLSQEGTVDRVNGVGLQYQVEFRSWRKFMSDIWQALAKLGG